MFGVSRVAFFRASSGVHVGQRGHCADEPVVAHGGVATQDTATPTWQVPACWRKQWSKAGRPAGVQGCLGTHLQK